MELKIIVWENLAILEDKAPMVIQKHLDVAITKATTLLLAEVKKRTPQGVYGAQGGLLASIKGEVLRKGTPMVKGIVCSNHPYAEVVEKGREPGGKMPPGANVDKYYMVKEKGKRIRKGEYLSHKKKSGERVVRVYNASGGLVPWIQKKFGVDIKKAIQLEFVVRRSIAKHGTEGAHMFENAYDAKIVQIMEIFHKAGFDITEELNK
ncbi:MAG: hypothetical protein CVU66_00655 [Deltaproteobacteria bacterium HGW-Deltaproteobacteria-23]|nr:MAG: hypothetical protein CVU66_00655 [Deltaproteobacteria bacterium HGW-Deltaproteobacteria-23]